MVDYSKWDNFKDSDDEDDEKTAPAVYKIDKGGSVTIPGRNVTIHSSPAQVL